MEPNNLIDQAVAVRISQPKAFADEHSTGPFAGVIVSVVENKAVIDLETAVVFRGEKIVQLVATPSFERDHLTLAALDRGIPVSLTPITQLDIAEFGDDLTIAAARRSWVLSGDLMLAGTDAPRLTESAPPVSR